MLCYVRFRHNCCYQNSITGDTECTTKIGNTWLNLLYSVLTIARFGLLGFGPVLFISTIEHMSKDNIPYVVRLREKLEKTVCFCQTPEQKPVGLDYERVLDLTTMRAFPKLRSLVWTRNVPFGRPVKVRFPQYDICVDYKRTLMENTVPVGLFQSLFRAMFKCHIRFAGPFRECCQTNMLYSTERQVPWTKCFRKVAKVILILVIPTPFYVRLFMFYKFECEALVDRKRAVALAGLREPFENSLIHYLTPTHGLFVFIYIVYAVTALVFAFLSRPRRQNRVQKIIVDSFRDLKRLAWTDTLSMFLANFVWPFREFGLLGCLVGLIYWPVAMPLSLVIAIVYSVPTIYLTVRMAVHSKIASIVKARRSHRKAYNIKVSVVKYLRCLNIIYNSECLNTFENSSALCHLSNLAKKFLLSYILSFSPIRFVI